MKFDSELKRISGRISVMDCSIGEEIKYFNVYIGSDEYSPIIMGNITYSNRTNQYYMDFATRYRGYTLTVADLSSITQFIEKLNNSIPEDPIVSAIKLVENIRCDGCYYFNKNNGTLLSLLKKALKTRK